MFTIIDCARNNCISVRNNNYVELFRLLYQLLHSKFKHEDFEQANHFQSGGLVVLYSNKMTLLWNKYM